MIDITDDLIQSFTSGKKKSVRIRDKGAFWDFKPSYLGCPSLHTRSAGYERVAMPYIEALEDESEEYKVALKIVKRIAERLD